MPQLFDLQFMAPLASCDGLCWLLQGAPPLKFAIFFAGALIRDRNLSYIYKEKVTLPSVHIIGDKDYVKEVICYATGSHVSYMRLSV